MTKFREWLAHLPFLLGTAGLASVLLLTFWNTEELQHKIFLFLFALYLGKKVAQRGSEIDNNKKDEGGE